LKLDILPFELSRLPRIIGPLPVSLAGVVSATETVSGSLSAGISFNFDGALEKLNVNGADNRPLVKDFTGNLEQAKALMTESQNLAATLAREVKDENGAVVMTLEETSAKAIEMVQRAGDGAAEALEASKADLEGQQEAMRGQLEQTEQSVSGIQTMIDQFTAAFTAVLQKFGVDVGSTMEGVKSAVEGEITPNINTDPARQAMKELADAAYRDAVAAKKAMIDIQKSVKASSTNLFDISRVNLKNLTKQYQRAMSDFEKYSAEANIEFTGTGSSKRPLSEKIAEMAGKMKSFLGGAQKGAETDIALQDAEGQPLTTGLQKAALALSSFLDGAANDSIGKMQQQVSGIGGAVSPNVRLSDPAASGAQAANLANLGTLDISNISKGGKIIGEKDVLEMLKNALNREQLLGAT